MDTSVKRTDPVLDNSPGIGMGSQKLVYLLLVVLASVLVGLGGYIRFLEKLSWLPEVCIAAGVAIGAPGILSYIYRKYMLEEIKLEVQKPAQEFKDKAEQMVSEAVKEITGQYRHEIALLSSAKEAGLVGVHISRPEAVKAFVPFMEDEKHEIILVGSSLRGLLKESDMEYEYARITLKRRMEDGIRLKFLLTHPVIADLRARQENRRAKDIGNEIVDSLEFLLNDKEWKVSPDNVKLYVGTPTCFGVKTAQAMLLNTYPYMREAFASPCLIVRRPGYFYEHFFSSHFRAWSSALAVHVPDNLDRLREDLENYAGRVDNLIEPLKIDIARSGKGVIT